MRPSKQEQKLLVAGIMSWVGILSPMAGFVGLRLTGVSAVGWLGVGVSGFAWLVALVVAFSARDWGV